MGYRLTHNDKAILFLDRNEVGRDLEVKFSKVKNVKVSEINPKITFSLDDYGDTQGIEITILEKKAFIKYMVDYDGALSTTYIKYAKADYFPSLEDFANSRGLKVSKDTELLNLEFSTEITDFNETLQEIIERLNETIESIFKVTESAVERPEITFEPEYYTDETPFRDIFLERLLRGLGFRGVRNTHGIKEYGKDFVFYEDSLIDRKRYFALQAKKGDIKGSAYKEEISTLIEQINTCFEFPFPDNLTGNKQAIDTVIVAISGKYKEQAQEKIKMRLNNLIHGSVIFLDKDDLIDLADKVNRNKK